MTAPRFGGELPAGCDITGPPRREPDDCLYFSHGRAALAWLLTARGPFTSALVSAYTCPVVPALLRQAGVQVAAVDVDVPMTEAAAALPGTVLVVVPAMFGFTPTLPPDLGERAMVLIDAAQTAFGHVDFPLPPAGAILSGPRKTLALGDGAVLRLAGCTESDRQGVAALPKLAALSAEKMHLRRLLAEGGHEMEAVALSRSTEAQWPDTAHSMTAAAHDALLAADAQAHARQRLRNRARLVHCLGGALTPAWDGTGTPFCHPVLVPDRAALLPRLHAARVFATPLWPDSWHDPARHPEAHALCRDLLALPVDQRYDESDMEHMAQLVLGAMNG